MLRSLLVHGAIVVTLLTCPIGLPAQVIWDRPHLDRVRADEFKDDEAVSRALKNLRELADRALQAEPRAVTQKSKLPPSGDRHDYMSFSRYWWPDPEKPDGLPYIRKDGIVNRELLAQGDRVRLGEFTEDVQSLALAGFLFDDERYSDHAARMMRTWFLDESTKMNANLNFGQAVPGRAKGRGPGIIDTRSFMWVLDSEALLYDGNAWSDNDRTQLQAWFAEYAQWLQTDELGLHERAATNNHGSWYAAQLARYLLFANQEDAAKQVVEEAKQRIDEQFDLDGNQEAELKRTRSLHYSVFNVTALANLARVGDAVGVNLWDHETQSSCGIRKGLDRLLPYLTGNAVWKHPQIDAFRLSRSSHMTLRMFSRHSSDPTYLSAASQIPRKDPASDFSALMMGKSP